MKIKSLLFGALKGLFVLIVLIQVTGVVFPSESSIVNYTIKPRYLSSSAQQTRNIEDVSHYMIEVELDTSTHILVANETVEYFNSETISLDEIVFKLWANANQGFVKIIEITDKDGCPLLYQTEEDINLKVKLRKSIALGERTLIQIRFILSVPNVSYRFGYSENLYNIANWYPIVAVYDENGWDTSPYSFTGESFYADVSNYDVNITVPASYVVAANGELVNKINLQNDKVKWIWKAKLMRDFVFSCSPSYFVASLKMGNLTLFSYYLNFKPHSIRGTQALHIAKNAIQTFSLLFGHYPYSTFSIVESTLGTGTQGLIVAGMEYPSLILVDDYFYASSSEHGFETVIAHEVAHQWFAFAVGNDPYSEPWLDEGFASYSEVLYYEFVHGRPEGKRHLNEMKSNYLSWQERHGDEIIGHSMEFWEDRLGSYYFIVYKKGTLVIDMLRLQVGNATFFKAMRTYFDKFLYKNAKISDLINVFEEVCGYDIDWFFDQWLFRKGFPSYHVVIIFEDSKNVIINIYQEREPKKMLVPFEIKYEERSVIKTVWINRTQQTIEFEVESLPMDVVMDPEDRILGIRSARTLWDPLVSILLTVMSGGIIGFAVSKKASALRAPPTSLDYLLEERLQKKKG